MPKKELEILKINFKDGEVMKKMFFVASTIFVLINEAEKVIEALNGKYQNKGVQI